MPSQVKRKFNAALNTVGVLNGSSDPLTPRSRAFALAPFVLVSWHEPQLSVLSCDRRGSRNSCSPSATRRGSSLAGAGIGVIGSAPDDDRTVGAAAVNAPASTASANKDAFRPGYGGRLPSGPALHTGAGIVSTTKRSSCSLLVGATAALLSSFDTDRSHVRSTDSANNTRLPSSYKT